MEKNKLWNKIICFINCFGELQKVNRKINIKYWEEEKLDTKYVIYKVCVYMYVFLYIYVNFQLRYESGYMCAQNIKPKMLFPLIVFTKLPR